MGTTYEVLKKDGMLIELDEGSNLFSLIISGKITHRPVDGSNPAASYTHRALTPADVITMALELIQAASYWADSDDIDDAVRAWAKQEGGARSYGATLLRNLGRVGQEGNKYD